MEGKELIDEGLVGKRGVGIESDGEDKATIPDELKKVARGEVNISDLNL